MPSKGRIHTLQVDVWGNVSKKQLNCMAKLLHSRKGAQCQLCAPVDLYCSHCYHTDTDCDATLHHKALKLRPLTTFDCCRIGHEQLEF